VEKGEKGTKEREEGHDKYDMTLLSTNIEADTMQVITTLGKFDGSVQSL
jgi:hypothetical protein